MRNLIPGKLVALSLVLMLGLTPVLSYAKNDDDNQNKGKNKDKSEINNNSCLKAFGHLIAPGFIKNKGTVSFFGDCFLPFGIGKKFQGIASSTPDTIAPIITKLSVRANTDKASITWDTNEKSDSKVFWSTSAGINVNNTSTASSSKSEMTKDHKITITGLSASTTYYLLVRSKDASGNVTTSSETSFTTKSTPLDNTPPIISSVAVLSSTSTIHISWHTNEPATSKLYYGNSSSLDVNASTTSFIQNNTLKENHTLTLNGLATSSTYYLSVESKDSSGNRTVTPTFTGTTSGL